MRNPFFILIFLLLVSFKTEGNQKLTLILDWFINPNHAPILVAKNQGFFQKRGLDVEIITPADPTDPPKWIALKKGDVALDYQPHVLLQIARGLPIKQVGTLIGTPLNCLVVLKSSSIQTLIDLKGKKIAYSSPEIDLLIVKKMLATVGLSEKDIVPINVHFDLTHALLTKKVAAAIGMMRNVELPELAMLGEPGKAFYPEDYGIPRYSELVFIMRKDKILDDQYDRFFKALNEAKNFLLKHPEECWRQFTMHYPTLNTPLNKVIWFTTLDKFANNLQAIDENQYKELASFLSAKLN